MNLFKFVIAGIIGGCAAFVLPISIAALLVVVMVFVLANHTSSSRVHAPRRASFDEPIAPMAYPDNRGDSPYGEIRD